MDSSTQIKGLISYLTKLTHTVDAFRVSFGNIEVGKTTRGMQSYAQIKYDLNVTPKQPDSPYLWDFFNCKSKHIIQDGCEMVGLSWAEVFTEVKDIYYNGRLSGKYGGNIPNSFIKKITKDIEQSSPKQINTHFFCGGDKKRLTLKVNYEVSDIYIDDGITTDVSVSYNSTTLSTIIPNSFEEIKTTTMKNSKTQVKKIDANAKLIASAPELLEALKEAQKLIEKHLPNELTAHDLINNAIRKATI